MSVLTLTTWNAEGMFVKGALNRRALPHDALVALKQLNSDIVVIPEFGVHGSLRGEIRTTIQSLGYQIVEVPYEDATMPEHIPEHYEMAVLSRLPIVSMSTHRLGGTRNSVEIRVLVDKKQVRILGVHLDDKSEQQRLVQAKDLVDTVREDVRIPTIVMGDFNAMHVSSNFAKLTRSKAAKLFTNTIQHEQIKSMAGRVHEMAAGTTIDYIEKHTKLQNLDPSNRHTVSGKQAGLEWMPAIRLAKLDWIFASRQFSVVSYRVARDVGSDHRPVVAIVRL